MRREKCNEIIKILIRSLVDIVWFNIKYFCVMLSIVFIIILLCTIINFVHSWKGQVASSYDTLALSSLDYADVDGLSLTVVTTEPNAKALFLVTMSAFMASTADDLKVDITINGVSIAPSSMIRYVKATHNFEILPISFMIYRAIPAAGSYTVKVRAAGNALLSDGSHLRRLSVIVMPAVTITSSTTLTSLVSASQSSLGLTASVTTTSLSDKVLVFLNLDSTDATADPDFSVTLQRTTGGSVDTFIGTLSSYGKSISIAAPLIKIDSPSLGTHQYSVLMNRLSGVSNAKFGENSETRSICAVLVPNTMVATSNTYATITISSISWNFLPLTVTITTLTSTEKVLLMFNAQALIRRTSETNTDTVTVYLAFYRDSTIQGTTACGLITINPGPVATVNRSPMMVYLDTPGAAGTYNYYVVARVQQDLGEIVFGDNSEQSTLSAVLVADRFDPSPAPSLPPSLPPSVSPSTNPTRVPTVVPTTMPIVDCTSGCTILSGAAYTLGAGNVFGKYILPKYFTITLQTTGTTKPPDSLSRHNIFDFVDSNTAASLLSVYTTESAELQYRYNGDVLKGYGPPLAAGTITVTISVTATSLLMKTSVNPGWVDLAFIPAIVDTTQSEYLLYLSNLGFTSAGGSVAAISITSKYSPYT